LISVSLHDLLDAQPGIGIDGGVASQKLIQDTSKEEHVTLAGKLVLTNIQEDLLAS
jgi:hypothetical protein